MDKLHYCSDVNMKPTQSKSRTFGRPKKRSRETGTFLLRAGQSQENWTNGNNCSGETEAERIEVMLVIMLYWLVNTFTHILNDHSALPSGSSSQRRKIHVNVGAFTIWCDIIAQRTSVLIQMAVLIFKCHRQKMYFVCDTFFAQVLNFIWRRENNVDI
jgi:hypothetical protein